VTVKDQFCQRYHHCHAGSNDGHRGGGYCCTGDEAVGTGVTGSSGAGLDGTATTVAPAAGDVNCNVAPSALYVVVVVTIPHCCRLAP